MSFNEEKGNFLYHEPCPKCGSKDNLARYDDGHGYCFGCRYYEKGEGEPAEPEPKQVNRALINYTPSELIKRRISEETCRKFAYGNATFDGKPVQVATYHDSQGNPVAQKLRFPNKDFIVIGDIKSAVLYGQNLWRDAGKMVIVTEGEIDCLSVSEIQSNKWPVVSIPSGASGAVKAIKKSLDWLQSFESVVLMFDNDEPGQEAARKCAELFAPGKCKIAHLPLKDANDMLVAGRGGEVITAAWQAKPYRPDGILDGSDVFALLNGRKKAFTLGQYDCLKLQAMTRGLRSREIVTICAGSGVGKSEFTRAIAYSLIKQGLKLGYIALEESVDRTALGLVGMELGQRIHFLDEPDKYPGFKESWDKVITDKVWFYDHFGSMEPENLLNRVRFMRTSLGCDIVVLDHLSIVISGLEEGDERRTIDQTMTKLRSISEGTGVGILLVSHLKRPAGTAHEEGGQTSLAQLRGSAAIGQLSDIVIGLERNQQDEVNKHITTVRILKNRYTGETGVAGFLSYDSLTGRMSETAEPMVASEGEDF